MEMGLERFEEVAATQSFPWISEPALEALLASDLLTATCEEHVLVALARWMTQGGSTHISTPVLARIHSHTSVPVLTRIHSHTKHPLALVLTPIHSHAHTLHTHIPLYTHVSCSHTSYTCLSHRKVLGR